MSTLADVTPVDLSDSRSYVAGVPHAWLAHLRRHDPVHWQEEAGGPGFWAVTRYEDCVTVNRDYERFSSAARGTMPFEMPEDGHRAAGPDDAEHGPAPAHPLPAPRQQGLHAAHGARPRGEHPPLDRRHHRPGRREGRGRLRHRHLRRAPPPGHRRAARRSARTTATACSSGPTAWSATRTPSTRARPRPR